MSLERRQPLHTGKVQVAIDSQLCRAGYMYPQSVRQPMKAAHASEAARYHCTYLPDLTYSDMCARERVKSSRMGKMENRQHGEECWVR